MGYKKEDIPLYEEEEYRPYREEEEEEEEYRTYGQEEEGQYRTYREEEEGEYGHYGEEEEMEGYGSNTVQEEVDYHTYRLGVLAYVCVCVNLLYSEGGINLFLGIRVAQSF